jgi:DNA-binding CsgD family transcriptional regulator
VDADSRPVRLTARKHEILRLLAAGSSTSEIVHQLSINADTVRTHIRNIFYKPNAYTRLEAVGKALRRRLL